MTLPTILTSPPTIFIYGPPGSGKSSAGRLLAQSMELPFWDLDAEIEARTRKKIPQIFAARGEAGFRRKEREVLLRLLAHHQGVISLGGGTLLSPRNRQLVEARGPVVCLTASPQALVERLQSAVEERPLLAGDLQSRLSELLAQRAEHYASFRLQLDADRRSSAEIAWEAQVRLGAFRVRGMGEPYDVRVQPGSLDALGQALAVRSLGAPVALVCDEQVAALYAPRALASLQRAGLGAHLVTFPAGEAHKTLATASQLWQTFLEAGLERGSTVVALGGGVTGDLAGFAAATFLRGLAWVAVPTSLLAMVDASLGGKTGIDLPSGKNLVGAFHPPRLVLADPQVLDTLPPEQLRNGLAEVVKHGLVGDPHLFERCARGWQALSDDWDGLIRQAMAVKIRLIQADPYEKGARAALNLGHTLGHALEQVSGYHLRHGEAVAIGVLAAARLSERLGLAGSGLSAEIAAVLDGIGLPTSMPANLDRAKVLAAMGVDKKRVAGKLHFVLPVQVGEVKTGVEIDDPSLVLAGI